MDHYYALRRNLGRSTYRPSRWPWWLGFSCVLGALGFVGAGALGGFEYVLTGLLAGLPTLGTIYLFAENAGPRMIRPGEHLVIVAVNMGWWMLLLRRVYIMDAEPGPAWGRLVGRLFLNLALNILAAIALIATL